MTEQIEVRTTAETPHNAGLYEAGKQLLVDSVEVGREFCKFMVGVSSGAIPTYLALVGLATGKTFRPSFIQGVTLAAPAVLFLFGAMVFAFGYFPVQAELSLDRPDEIERARAATMRRRTAAAVWGFGVFGVAVLSALAATAFALSIEVPLSDSGK